MKKKKIGNTPKEEYMKLMKEKMKKATFSQIIELKLRSKTKRKNVHYQKLQIQSYIKKIVVLILIKLLFSLRSKSYPAKII